MSDSRRASEAFIQTMHRFQRMNFSITANMSRVTQGEFFALNIIKSHGEEYPESKGVYVSELALKLRVSPPAVSRMLRVLEQRGLIERCVDREDRRNTYVVLTEEGRTVQREQLEQSYAFCQRVLERLGDGEAEHLIYLWNKVIDIMQEEIAKET